MINDAFIFDSSLISRIWRIRTLSKAQSIQTVLTFAILIRFWILLILSIRNVVFCLISNFYVIKILGTRDAILLTLIFVLIFCVFFRSTISKLFRIFFNVYLCCTKHWFMSVVFSVSIYYESRSLYMLYRACLS